MARDGLLLTYLCNRVDAETSEQVIAIPFGLLQDCLDGNGVVDLQVVVENGESYVVAAWNDGLVQCERNYPAQDPPDDHLIPDLAWHTVDERLARTLQSPEKHTNQESRAPSHRLARCPIATEAH